MPSLFRFLTVLAIIGGIVYGVIFALANFVNPKSREMIVTIPADRFLRIYRSNRTRLRRD